MTADPLAFLHAAHAAAQAEAEAATAGPWWYNPGKQCSGPDAFERYDLSKGDEFVGYGGPSPFVGAVAATGPADNPQSMADAAFIAANDPAAVLRRIAADRKLIAEHPHTTRVINPVCGLPSAGFGCDNCHNWDGVPEGRGYCDTIEALAEGWGWTGETT